MVKDIVTSIVDAEKEAEKRIENARKQAEKILLDAENENDVMRNNAASVRKELIKERDRKSQELSSLERKKVLDAGTKAVDSKAAAYKKKVSAAAAFIAESII